MLKKSIDQVKEKLVTAINPLRLKDGIMRKNIDQIGKNLRARFQSLQSVELGPEENSKDEGYFVRIGWIVLVGGFGGFMLWAMFAPLDKGIPATGTVIISGQKKVIQSANNGVIESVLVKDGDQVREGQVLIKLNDLQNSSLVSGLKAQIKGQEIIVENLKVQLKLVGEQLVGMRALERDGYVARNRLLELERTSSQIQGFLSEAIGALDGNRSKLRSLEYELVNTEVKSPYDGSILNLEVLTKGSVVQSGTRLLEIAPLNLPLMVETIVPVNLIDKVYVDLPVEIIFSALNQRKTPKIPGRVVTVPADRSIDKQTGAPFYKVLIEVTDVGMKKLADNVIRSGMPAEVFIITGERTMLNYLLRPILDRVYTSMREE